MRFVHAYFVAASVAAYSGFGSVPAQAASTPRSQSQAQRQAVLKRAPTRASDTASTGDVVVSTSFGVFVYSAALKPVAQINVQNSFGNPLGLALDAAGDLYVANGGTNGIPVYKNDYKTLIATLTAPMVRRGSPFPKVV